MIDGDHIEVAEQKRLFLKEKGHELKSKAGGAITQLIVQTLQNPADIGQKNRKYMKNTRILHGTLTAVSDPRKNGRPAAV